MLQFFKASQRIPYAVISDFCLPFSATVIHAGIVVDEIFPSVAKEEHYFYIGRGGALVHILTEWYRTGMKDSPEYMANLCDRFFSVFRTDE